jgi:hypothetical protein
MEGAKKHNTEEHHQGMKGKRWFQKIVSSVCLGFCIRCLCYPRRLLSGIQDSRQKHAGMADFRQYTEHTKKPNRTILIWN